MKRSLFIPISIVLLSIVLSIAVSCATYSRMGRENLPFHYKQVAMGYFSQRDFNMAKKYLLLAAEEHLKIDQPDHDDLADVYVKLAFVYLEMKEDSEAIKSLLSSLEELELSDIEDHRKTAEILETLAGIYESKKNYSEATRYYIVASEKYGIIDSLNHTGISALNLGRVYTSLSILFIRVEEIEKAQEYLALADQVWEEIKLLVSERDQQRFDLEQKMENIRTYLKNLSYIRE